jgi:hypothetical protein
MNTCSPLVVSEYYPFDSELYFICLPSSLRQTHEEKEQENVCCRIDLREPLSRASFSEPPVAISGV